MSASLERVLQVGKRPLARPRLSVLIPFHADDATPLLERLVNAPQGVEIILLDDGTGKASLIARLMKAAEATGAPSSIIIWANNGGRSAARNRLLTEARGEYILYLDADMLPDSPDFLQTWLNLIQHDRPFVAFGGLSLKHAAPTAETALHHGLFGRSDCRPAREREKNPVQSVASANLLVRRDFLADIRFDPAFTGWGWEDVDWALRASKHAPITHIENPATHAGLDNIDTLMRKCAEAGPNFARLARKHPEAAARFMSHRVARALKFVPLRSTWRALCAWLARDPLNAAPMALRCTALKLYRASYYAEHLP